MNNSDNSEAKGNTIALARYRRVCFTLNNYKEEDINSITSEFKQFVIGKEVGENGTPHLQGYGEFKKQTYFTTMKKINENIHWERAKGSREQNIKYCTKDNNFITNMPIPEPLELITELRPWQKDVEHLILKKPDKRTIHWYWDATGGKGKTELMKYLCTKYEWCTFSKATKSADILTIADPTYKCYIFDFSRTVEGFTPWHALESLKDGAISDSKLKKKTRNIIMNSPHVICFANWPPDERKLSKDRWNVKDLEGPFTSSESSSAFAPAAPRHVPGQVS